jgi:hypothetical protein
MENTISMLREIAGIKPEVPDYAKNHVSNDHKAVFQNSGLDWWTWLEANESLVMCEVRYDDAIIKLWRLDNIAVDNDNDDIIRDKGLSCSENAEIPQQFTPETLSGNYYNAYQDGEQWRYDTLTFSDPDGECESEYAAECGNLSVNGKYIYDTRWELWEEPEGNVISWEIPALGKQWLAICHRAEDHHQMLWKISKGDLIVALREFQCSEEYFFFSVSNAEAFINEKFPGPRNFRKIPRSQEFSKKNGGEGGALSQRPDF